MNLYERDYCTLQPDEKQKLEVLKKLEVVGNMGDKPIIQSRFREYPKAARHFVQLFPNQYLDIVELEDKERLHSQISAFTALLKSEDVSERKILNFIVQRRAYFLIGSLLSRFPFGHHGAYLFPEFQLGNSFKVDYLLVGENSGGWHFVFVELESPAKKITLADGNLGDSFRKGLAQVEDWKTWIESRYSSISETFEKATQDRTSLPAEFYQLDLSRIHFAVVAGRRSDFKEHTYRICRRKSHLLIHYDNIVDAAIDVVRKATY